MELESLYRTTAGRVNQRLECFTFRMGFLLSRALGKLPGYRQSELNVGRTPRVLSIATETLTA